MSVLASLSRAYDRLSDRAFVPPFGYSRTNVGFCVVLTNRGTPAFPPIDWRDPSARSKAGRRLNLPTPLVQRTSGIAPNFLWDKTAYALGVTRGDAKRTAQEHQAFVDFHQSVLGGTSDEGLLAFLRFTQSWEPPLFETLGWSEELRDENLVFALESEYQAMLLHEREAARKLWLEILGAEHASEATCLVSGERERIARSHPPLRGVLGAQSSGAFIVSYNAAAFESYGHREGDNAPVSEHAAFAYTATLNRFLERGSHNRIQIGDSTTVFWADASDAADIDRAEAVFGALFDDVRVDDEVQARKVRTLLEKIRSGRPAVELNPDVPKGVRFYILGLSPNAARLAVRFWLQDTFEHFARRLAEHYADLALEPTPWRATAPSIQRLLLKTTALREKFENIPPLLGGEMARAVLTGSRYPRTLLATAIVRLRAGGGATSGFGWHAAVIKAYINRATRISRLEEESLPVTLNPDHPSPAYQLGRLFAVLESAQYAALGRVNAPIGDRYYGAASATPARVFGPLLRGLRNHISDARKRGRGGWIEPRVEQIMAKLPPELPRTLRLEDQGRFAVGYYHERATRPTKPGDENKTEGEGNDE